MAAERWDIFCRVVDNFGDAGVCWRLARQLATDHGLRVRLWIDDLATLAALDPRVQVIARQSVNAVEIGQWDEAARAPSMPEIVVEAFGCGLPDAYLGALERQAQAPLWIVLEYLSAEPWVNVHHGLPSPHPRLPIERYFFFPGLARGTGGVLREANLLARHDAHGPRERAAFWRSLGQASPDEGATTISLFGYPGAPLAPLMRCWEEGPRPVVLALTRCGLREAALAHAGLKAFPAAGVVRRGALEMRDIPFLPQPAYDELLWSCDCNFVRGEDSFVRAQWAARPFVWQIYPQEGQAHATKLDAFLEVYDEALPDRARTAARDMMRAWNQIAAGAVASGSVWPAYAAELPTMRAHGAHWSAQLAALGTLAENLVQFCLGKLK